MGQRGRRHTLATTAPRREGTLDELGGGPHLAPCVEHGRNYLERETPPTIQVQTQSIQDLPQEMATRTETQLEKRWTVTKFEVAFNIPECTGQNRTESDE